MKWLKFLLFTFGLFSMTTLDQALARSGQKPGPNRPNLREVASTNDRSAQNETTKNDPDLKLAAEYDKQYKWSQMVVLLAPKLNTLDRQGLILLAKAYGGLADSVNRIRVLELASSKAKNDYYILTLLGDAMVENKQFDKALDTYKQVLEINSKYEPAFVGVFNAYNDSGNKYEARNAVGDLIKRFGKKPVYLSHLCRIFSIDDFLKKTVETCEEATTLDKKNEMNYIYLSQAYINMKMPEKGLAALEKALKHFPKSSPVALALGQYYWEQKDFVQSKKYFRQAVVVDEKSTEALIGYANSCFELHLLNEALESFVRACKINGSLSRELRAAYVKLRAQKDEKWVQKYEQGMNRCL